MSKLEYLEGLRRKFEEDYDFFFEAEEILKKDPEAETEEGFKAKELLETSRYSKFIKEREDIKKRIEKAKAKADGELTRALKTIFAIAENYPKLRASENFKLLQEQLEGVENKVAYSRQFYNDSVLGFNNTITTVPGKWFAGMTGKRKTREFFEIKEVERKAVKVKF